MESARWKNGSDLRRLMYRVVEHSELPDGLSDRIIDPENEDMINALFEDVKKQWSVVSCHSSFDGVSTCTCGKRGIVDIYTIENRLNEAFIEVGCECVNKFQDERLRRERNEARRSKIVSREEVLKLLSAGKLLPCIVLKRACDNCWISKSQKKGYSKRDSTSTETYRTEVNALIKKAAECGVLDTANDDRTRNWLKIYPGGKGFGARKDIMSGRWYWMGDLRYAPAAIVNVIDVDMV